MTTLIEERIGVFEAGKYNGISNEAYHGANGVSRSDLYNFSCKSPWHYLYGKHEDKPAFDFGTAVHYAVLQPEEFNENVVMGPDARRGTKEWSVFEQDNQGKIIMKPDDFTAVLQARKAVMAHPIASRLFYHVDRQVEVSYWWHEKITGTLCKCRPDLILPSLGWVVDLKTTRAGGGKHENFQKDLYAYRYFVQAAFYLDGSAAIENAEMNKFFFVVVEKEEPYLVSMFEVEPAAIEYGRKVYVEDLFRLNEFEKQENPVLGYPTEILPIGLPEWAMNRLESY